jgi:hypothetical protein
MLYGAFFRYLQQGSNGTKFYKQTTFIDVTWKLVCKSLLTLVITDIFDTINRFTNDCILELCVCVFCR